MINNKNTLFVAAIVLGLAALLHLTRVFAGWGLIIGNWVAPPWLSIIAFLIAGPLSYKLYVMSKNK